MNPHFHFTAKFQLAWFSSTPVGVQSGIGCAIRLGGLISTSRPPWLQRSGRKHHTSCCVWWMGDPFLQGLQSYHSLTITSLPLSFASPLPCCLASGSFTFPKPPAPPRLWVSKCQLSKIWPQDQPTQSWDGFSHLQQKPFQKAERELGTSYFPCWMCLWLQKPIAEAQP